MRIRSIIPRDASDPADQRRTLKQAQRELDAIYAKITRRTSDFVKSLKAIRREGAANTTYRQPTELEREGRSKYDLWKPVKQVNQYIYELDAQRYMDIEQFFQQLYYEELLESQSATYTPSWWFNTYTTQAYSDATKDMIDDVQSSGVLSQIPEQEAQQLESIDADTYTFNPAAQRRLGLVYARTFNLMKGLSDQSKTDLSETLSRSMLDGKGIPAITRDVSERIGISYRRAIRIARTEVMQAYRSATRDESREINETVFDDSPWHMQLLWFSALASTTRPNHAAKHGGIYSQDQVREFYNTGANAINCYCSQRPIMVNKKTGEFIQKKLVEKLKEQKAAWRPGMAREI